MTAPRKPLDKQERHLVCTLADPVCDVPDFGEITGCDADGIFDAALDHNVEPVLVRKLSKLDFSGFDAFAERLAKAAKDQMFMSAITQALEDQADRIRHALESEDIPHALVKGGAFARELYPVPSDRPYSDVDILLPKTSLEPAMQIMSRLGYTRFKRAHFDRSAANEEQKWGLEGNPLLLVELHTNLVHMPSLRNRVSLGYEDYMTANGGGAHPKAGYFAVAVMHAAAGHKFHQLKLLVDVLQAARALGPGDLDHIANMLPQMRIHPEISMCLALLDELFCEAREGGCTGRIRAALNLPFCWKPVDADAVMNAPSGRFWRSKIRRHAFRYYQITVAPRPGV